MRASHLASHRGSALHLRSRLAILLLQRHRPAQQHRASLLCDLEAVRQVMVKVVLPVERGPQLDLRACG